MNTQSSWTAHTNLKNLIRHIELSLHYWITLFLYLWRIHKIYGGGGVAAQVFHLKTGGWRLQNDKNIHTHPSGCLLLSIHIISGAYCCLSSYFELLKSFMLELFRLYIYKWCQEWFKSRTQRNIHFVCYLSLIWIISFWILFINFGKRINFRYERKRLTDTVGN